MNMRGTQRVICVGDSITFGEHVTSDKRWTSRMALARPEWNVLNRGVNGETTRDGLLRFPMDVQAPRPDVTIIQFGHNDANTWKCDNGLPRVSRECYCWNLVEMATRAAHFGSKVLIVAPHATRLDNDYNKRVDSYSDESHLAAKLTKSMWYRVEIERQHLLDGLHLNELGHEIAADRLAILVEGCR